ncbi:hypothetical protein OG462_35650 [Streptomyces sp. NBC_01077]|uniref:hypothetical protein n=1 Tax=Streptomyces sp. NBC_01077 TaxID=2903746 RepID=UPI003863DBDC|nr:hypothetical protein OG462_35650 [Streptomyces sp. NBC_01077]
MGDIDTIKWIWTVRRRTTPAPGGLAGHRHPDVHKITAVGAAFSAHLSVLRAPRSLPSPIVVAR